MKYVVLVFVVLLNGMVYANDWKWENNPEWTTNFNSARVATRPNFERNGEDVFITIAVLERRASDNSPYLLFSAFSNFADLCTEDTDYREDVRLVIQGEHLQYVAKCLDAAAPFGRMIQYYPANEHSAVAAIRIFRFAKKWVKVEVEKNTETTLLSYFDSTGFTRMLKEKKY